MSATGQVARHRELAHVDDVPWPRSDQVVDGREQAPARLGLVASAGGRQPAPDQVRLDRAREGRDAPRARDEVDLVEHRLEADPGLLDPLERCRTDQGQPMVAEPLEEMERDERRALHQVERRRAVDDEDVQSHGTTAPTFDAIQRSIVASPGWRRRFASTKRSQYRSAVERRPSSGGLARSRAPTSPASSGAAEQVGDDRAQGLDGDAACARTGRDGRRRAPPARPARRCPSRRCRSPRPRRRRGCWPASSRRGSSRRTGAPRRPRGRRSPRTAPGRRPDRGPTLDGPARRPGRGSSPRRYACRASALAGPCRDASRPSDRGAPRYRGWRRRWRRPSPGPSGRGASAPGRSGRSRRRTATRRPARRSAAPERSPATPRAPRCRRSRVAPRRLEGGSRDPIRSARP